MVQARLLPKHCQRPRFKKITLPDYRSVILLWNPGRLVSPPLNGERGEAVRLITGSLRGLGDRGDSILPPAFYCSRGGPPLPSPL